MSPCDQDNAEETIIFALLGPSSRADSSLMDGSIYIRLKNYLTKPDESLDPSPEINTILSELVSLLQGSSRDLGLTKDACFADIEGKVCDYIDKNESLAARANAIRSIAIRSETRLELYWARRLVKSTTPVYSTMSAIEKIHAGSGAFPYFGNYACMVQTESEVIQTHLRQNHCKDCPMNKSICVAFCGSGPLPLTGILLSVCLKAKVILIDNDQESVYLSQKLIENWEAREIIPSGSLNVVCADGGQVRFLRNAGQHFCQGGQKANSVECDILFVAALIPNRVKEDIARNVAEMRDNGPLVVMRTAHGLTARFAYFQNRRKVIERYLSFKGLVVPESHGHRDGHVVDDDVKPIDFFPKEILNSLELFEWKAPQQKS